jgi:uncharacterized membrane protein
MNTIIVIIIDYIVNLTYSYFVYKQTFPQETFTDAPQNISNI